MATTTASADLLVREVEAVWSRQGPHQPADVVGVQRVVLVSTFLARPVVPVDGLTVVHGRVLRDAVVPEQVCPALADVPGQGGQRGVLVVPQRHLVRVTVLATQYPGAAREEPCARHRAGEVEAGEPPAEDVDGVGTGPLAGALLKRVHLLVQVDDGCTLGRGRVGRDHTSLLQ
ncbi:hypothetical protein [Streptomyces barringtoniae]|uniref:hypothetical protein n=1 Tax=Streptomyces barringtoniae TaxID=2892029 RepID=UPI001E2C86B6|nr:hypothetical protein [Streptomyces barringtoniae]MCC5481237.1 hypothetical protein [Streptomyces barringtoniae]